MIDKCEILVVDFPTLNDISADSSGPGCVCSFQPNPIFSHLYSFNKLLLSILFESDTVASTGCILVNKTEYFS